MRLIDNKNKTVSFFPYILIILICTLVNKCLCNKQCHEPVDLTKCNLPPKISNQTKLIQLQTCNLTLSFIDCMSSILNNLCSNETELTSNLKKTIKKFNLNYEINCEYIPKNHIRPDLKLHKKSLPDQYDEINQLQKNTGGETIFRPDEDCPNLRTKKCESKSLHITCGYPAANPNSNLNAYCNELKHYIRCAKCKTEYCNLESNIVSLRKHLSTQVNNFNEKCSASTTTATTTTKTTSTTTTSTTTKSSKTTTTSTITTSKMITKTTNIKTDIPSFNINTELFDSSKLTSLSQNITNQTIISAEILITTTTTESTSTLTTTTNPTTIITTPMTTTTSTLTTTQTEPQTSEITTKSKIQEHLDKILEQNLIIKNRQNYTKTQTTISIQKTKPIDSLNNSMNKSMTKIDHLLISFDHIDLKRNSVDCITSERGLIYYPKLFNRTDIFKGVRSGAIYLHPKTSLTLNLLNKTSDLCLTSLSTDKIDLSCSNGWSVSFWIKISYLNLFDKTILKVDNFFDNKIDQYSKYFMLKVSSYDLKIEFLYRRKFWALTQNLIWKSEWNMLTFTWSEFEGITVHVNGHKIICQQTYEYYASNDIYGTTLPSNRFDDNDELNSEKLERFFEKRSFNQTQQKQTGIIYIGLNNKLNRNSRKFYWNFRDQSNNQNQNINITSSFSESILLDELAIINHRITSKEVAHIYQRDYSIKNDYDSVEEKMYLMSTDSKQIEILPLQGALIRKYKDNWYLNLNGEKHYALVPSLFDSCIMDAENLCTFGFTAIVWIRFLYNFRQFQIENNFEQALFFIGKQDFSTGLEAYLNIYPEHKPSTSSLNYNYILTIYYKSKKYEISKNYKLFLNEITDLNNLNYLTIQFTDINNLDISLYWSSQKLTEIDRSKVPSHKSSYSSYELNDLKDIGLKSSILSSSTSIGMIGDFQKQSYFSIQNFELRNYVAQIDRIEYEFEASNPNIFEFDSIDKLNKIQNLNINGQPMIVDSKYGKSMLISNLDQKLTFKNVTDKCFGNLNKCKNGYTLKIYICFTNYNSNTKLKNQDKTSNVNRKIYLISNGAAFYTDYSFSIYYDFNKSALIVNLKTSKKIYRIEVGLKLKYFIWYTFTVTWEEKDGLRVYINNKLVEHTSGSNYKNVIFSNISNPSIEFTIGKSDYDLEDYSDLSKLNNKTPINFFDQSDNQTEDTEKIRKLNTNNSNFNLNKNKSPQMYQYLNTNEFIIHKLIQYNVKKYPDEIINRNIIIQQDESINKSSSSSGSSSSVITFFSYSQKFWYTLSFVFLSVSSLILIIFTVVMVKRRASNGFWSRENDFEINVSNKNKLKKKKSSLCCRNSSNEDEVIDAGKSNFDLELKNCNLRASDRLSSKFSCDEFATNSLYGTIDRLIVKKTVSLSTNANQTVLYTNNYNSLTKDPKMKTSTSYIINADDDALDKSEIHF